MTLNQAALFEQIGYRPHRCQQLYHSAPQRFRVACCGRRFGKSTMAARDRELNLFTPDQRGWIVGPTYDLGEKEFRVMWDDLIIGQKLGRDKRVKKAYNRRTGEMFMEFPWQSRVEVRSAQHPEHLVGEALNWAIMSEAAKQNAETWERFIRPSLSDYRGPCDFPTTPEGNNWLYDLWMLSLNPEVSAMYAAWNFPSWMNDVVYPGGREDPEIKLIEATTSDEWFAQEIAADFTSFVGRIYSEFNPTTHVRAHTYRPDWPNYMAVDFGFVNELAAIEFQISPRDEVFVWREHYKSYWTLEKHVAYMKSRPQPEGYKIDLAFGDPADPEGIMYLCEHFTQTIGMPEAKVNWREGVDLVKTFLKPRDTGVEIDEYGTPADPVPGLLVDPSCLFTISEFNGYRAPEEVKATTKESSQAKAINPKQKDNAMDALRYGLVHCFLLGCRQHLADAQVSRGTVQPSSSSGGNLFSNGDGGTIFTEGMSL